MNMTCPPPGLASPMPAVSAVMLSSHHKTIWPAFSVYQVLACTSVTNVFTHLSHWVSVPVWPLLVLLGCTKKKGGAVPAVRSWDKPTLASLYLTMLFFCAELVRTVEKYTQGL